MIRPVKNGKRLNGEGSIYLWTHPSGKRYYKGRITLPNGKVKEIYRKTKGEVRDELLVIRNQIANNNVPTEMTFKKWVEHWLDEKSDSLAYKTVSQYKRNISIAVDEFGSCKLKRLTVHDLQLFLKKLRNHGKSNSWVHQVMTNLRGCLRDAFREDLIPKDIASQVKGVPTSGKRKFAVLSDPQWKVLIDESRVDPAGLVVELAMKTAMRINEVLDLKYEQFDDQGYVTVGKSKTKAGENRTVAIDAALTDRLKNARALHNEQQLQDPNWNPENFIICTSQGTRANYQNLQKRVLTPMLQRLDFPHLSWHDLRKNMASKWFDDMHSPAVISQALGHKKISTTTDYYVKARPEGLDKLRESTAKFG